MEDNARSRLPVGLDDFKKLREGYLFVDKTRFIKEFLDNHSEVTLITRPRRFGKSMTLSMAKYFFTLEKAAENRSLFDGTDIEKAGEKYMKEQGQWPVVLLSLKDIKPLKYSLMLVQMADRVKKLYKEHRYLVDEGFLQGEDYKDFQDILYERASEGKLQLALGNLLEYLQRYHQKRVILLIDEYDVPVQAAWSAEESYYSEAIAFMRTFLTAALKGNAALQFGIMTGVLRVAKESIFSALNNLYVSSVVNGKYADIFGFTQEETARLASAVGREDKLEELKRWYDGYNFSGFELYNPWSVVNYFASGCQPDIFWLNSSGNAIIAELMEHAEESDDEKLLSLLEGESVEAVVDEAVIYTDIYTNKDALYTMLLTAGYLKAVDSRLEDGERICTLAIPNSEIATVYRKEILNRYRGRMARSDLLNVLTCLAKGQAEKFSSGLQKYLEQIASFHDTANKESFYHGFLLGLTAWFLPKYRVKSNRESGYGRFDLGIFPRVPGQAGIIMEFKVADREEDMPKEAEAALAQIERNDYLSDFREQGVARVWKYGIAFCGKKLSLVRG